MDDDKIKKILAEYTEKLKSVYADKLARVILFGSYARGDYTADSDIDIMIILADDEDGMRKKEDELASVTFDFDMAYDVYIQPVTQIVNTFNYWQKVHPLYQDICKEGVVLYDAA